MTNPPKTVIRMPGETDEELKRRREETIRELDPRTSIAEHLRERLKIGTPADNQTRFKCIDCEKIFTDEEPTILNIDDWLGIYKDYGPVCEACAKEIREGDYESIASW